MTRIGGSDWSSSATWFGLLERSGSLVQEMTAADQRAKLAVTIDPAKEVGDGCKRKPLTIVTAR
jgi:hypothetical protein